MTSDIPGLDDEIPENKTARIEFRNPEEHEDADYCDDREYYEALHTVRNYLGRGINYPVGKWLVAIRKAHFEDDLNAAKEMTEQLLNGYTDKEIKVIEVEE